MRDKLIIFGIGETAATIFEYFQNDSNYKILGFTAHKRYIHNDSINDLPIFPFEDLNLFTDPRETYLFPAVSYTNLNKDRSAIFRMAKNAGFKIPTFISSRSYISPTSKLGEGVFVYDNVSINHKCFLNENTIICSGTTISHSTIIGKNTFIAPNSTIGGFVNIGDNCFVGIGSTIVDKVNLVNNVILSAGSVLFKSADYPNIYKGNPATNTKLESEQFLLLNGEIS